MNKRIPQKINSIEKKERLAETCYYLACQTPYESITISEICDRAKVSVGTFYSYFDSKSDIIKYSIMNYSKPILFPIYNNINLLKFKKNTVIKTITKMINISIDTISMTKSSYKNIFSIILSNDEYLEIYKQLLNEELNIIYNKCIQNTFTDNNLKKTINITQNIINNFVFDYIIKDINYINFESQKTLLEKHLLLLWEKHTK